MPDNKYICKKIEGPIKINGDLTKKVWKGIIPITDFETPWAKPKDLKQKTECRLCFDDKFLYVGYIAHDIDIRFNNRCYKGEVCLDDVVEIFIDPTPKDKTYFGFEVNAEGDYLDYECTFYRKFNRKWSSKHFKTKTIIKQGKFFSCEMALPFVDLGIYPKNNEMWKMGLFRCDYNIINGVRTEEYQLWQNNGNKTPDFHKEKSFGKLIFKM